MSEFATTASSINFPVAELTLASITIFVFVILAIVMLCMIIHLIHKICTKWKKKYVDGTRTLIFFLITTVFGILCFELSLLFIIIVVIQIFLLDDIIKSRTISSNFFFQTYPAFEYLIGIFDSLGHLFMLLIFIGRFQRAFDNEIFNQSKWLIRSLYTMLFILSIVAMIIMLYVIPSHTQDDLLFLEIVWEICVESSILFILFLFVSNLYKLLKLSLWGRLKKNQNPNDLLSEITKMSLESSKSSRNKKKSTKDTPAQSKKSKVTLTIDGNVVEPMSIKSSNKSPITATNTPNTSINKSSGYQSDKSMATDNEDNDDNINTTTSSVAASVSHPQTLEILTVMSKMTLLVIIAATVSFLTIIGNVIIESNGAFNEKDLYSNVGLDHDAIWVFILPVFDMVITSFMLYLQFNFTHKTYHVMCRCLDSVFLRCMIGIIAYVWKIESDRKNVSSVVDDCKEVKDLQTKSTVSSIPRNPMPMTPPTYDDIQIEMQSVVR